MAARSTFDQELEHLNIDLIKMGSLVEEAIEKSIDAFKNQDIKEAKAVIEADNLVDEMEKQIESRCLSLILRQQPIAGDLRKISTAIKITTDMERIGDQAADIAELVTQINGDHIFEVVKHIPAMSEIASRMVHDSISAFVNGDLELANDVIKTDDEVDNLFCNVKADLAYILKHEKDSQNNSIDFLMIAKYLERIADHAVNICEWVVFSKTGIYKEKRIL